MRYPSGLSVFHYIEVLYRDYMKQLDYNKP